MTSPSAVYDAHPLGHSTAPSDDCIVSSSSALCDALDRAERVALVDTTVLITGETGTGKELMANHIHGRSRRAARAIVAVNLAAMPEALVVSEMFGHEQGAFTGASQRRIGRFECADRSTLFLDEVGELSAEMQIALLRVVQEGAFERLGASQTRRVNVRLIAATNRSLEQAVDEGRFRSDLYYRLNVFPIHLPPLRDRLEDIPLLAECFLRRLTSRLGRRFVAIEPESVDRLKAYSWPGNIRELQNVIEHSAILCDDTNLAVPAELLVNKSPRPTTGPLDAVLHQNELQLIEQALEQANGRVSGPSGAAARLGLPPSTLESKIKRHNIDKLRYRGSSSH